jgi:hypothetical protein
MLLGSPGVSLVAALRKHCVGQVCGVGVAQAYCFHMLAHLSADLSNGMSSSSSSLEHTVCILHDCEHCAKAGWGVAWPLTLLEHVPPALHLPGAAVVCCV